jgi:hypothetical protein
MKRWELYTPLTMPCFSCSWISPYEIAMKERCSPALRGMSCFDLSIRLGLTLVRGEIHVSLISSVEFGVKEWSAMDASQLLLAMS